MCAEKKISSRNGIEKDAKVRLIATAWRVDVKLMENLFLNVAKYSHATRLSLYEQFILFLAEIISVGFDDSRTGVECKEMESNEEITFLPFITQFFLGFDAWAAILGKPDARSQRCGQITELVNIRRTWLIDSVIEWQWSQIKCVNERQSRSMLVFFSHNHTMPKVHTCEITG